jgi:hypothetical protein
MHKRAIIAALLLLLPPAAQAQESVDSPPSPESPASPDTDKMPEANAILLQGLNKVTGRTSKIDGPIGTVMRFGSLEIIPRKCWMSAPDERPDNAALLQIREIKPGEAPKDIFLGWMFSSSPGLSGLEHAVYDVNVVACEVRKDPEHPDPEPKAPEPDKKDAAKKPAPKSADKTPPKKPAKAG